MKVKTILEYKSLGLTVAQIQFEKGDGAGGGNKRDGKRRPKNK